MVAPADRAINHSFVCPRVQGNKNCSRIHAARNRNSASARSRGLRAAEAKLLNYCYISHNDVDTAGVWTALILDSRLPHLRSRDFLGNWSSVRSTETDQQSCIRSSGPRALSVYFIQVYSIMLRSYLLFTANTSYSL